MKVQLVVLSDASVEAPVRSAAEVLSGLGVVQQVLPHAWVVLTAESERGVLTALETAFHGALEGLVVRLDLGGFAAHLGAAETLSQWVRAHVPRSATPGRA